MVEDVWVSPDNSGRRGGPSKQKRQQVRRHGGGSACWGLLQEKQPLAV